MKNRKHRDILLALALTLCVGLLLYFLAQPAGIPRTLNNPIPTTWLAQARDLPVLESAGASLIEAAGGYRYYPGMA